MTCVWKNHKTQVHKRKVSKTDSESLPRSHYCLLCMFKHAICLLLQVALLNRIH